MSLYIDEDPTLTLPSSLPVPLLDPVQALRTALIFPADSPEQAKALETASSRFESNPKGLPELCAQLLPMVVDGGETLLRRWTLEMVGFVVGRGELGEEVKVTVAQASLEALVKLLMGNEIETLKAVIPIFSTIHPILFNLIATGKSSASIHSLFQISKTRIVSLALDPSVRSQSPGIRACAWKFIQKILLAGTRPAAADPRLRASANAGDIHLGIIVSASMFDVGVLEEEVRMIQTQLVTTLYTSTDPSTISPLLNLLPPLIKSRPSFCSLLIPSLTSWTPITLQSHQPPLPAMQIRNVEKTLRLVLTHLLRVGAVVAFQAQINEALIRQRIRMEGAWIKEVEERRRRREGKKRAVEGGEGMVEDLKRVKIEGGGRGKRRGEEVDVSSLDLRGVIEAVMQGLGSIPVEHLQMAFNDARRAILEGSEDAVPALASALGVTLGIGSKPGQAPPAGQVIAVGEAAGSGLKEEDDVDEVLNPLDMDNDDEEDLLLETDETILEEEELQTISSYTLPPPGPLESDEKTELVSSAFQRIWLAGKEMETLPNVMLGDGMKLAVEPKEMWMLLVARLGTRGMDGEKRGLVVDWAVADFPRRSKFASIWLNEIFYNDHLHKTTNYPTILSHLLSSYLPKLDSKDRTLLTFLASLPSLPSAAITTLETLALDPDNGIIACLALRDIVESRPPSRKAALGVLLEMCTIEERKIRVMGIKTVLRWVPDGVVSGLVLDYALGILKSLAEEGKGEGDETGMEEEVELYGDVKVKADDAYSPSRYLSTLTPSNLPQHLELLLALSRRYPPLLSQLFSTYTRVSPEIQIAIENLITPLIQSLGANPALLEVLRGFLTGGEGLALKVVEVLGGEGLGSEVVGLIKGWMAERELDVRFIIPIIGDLDKEEIGRQIPNIVGLLGTSENPRDMVKTAFASVLQKISPADLMVTLHGEAVGRKVAIEAIGLCFSMTTVFRSDVLATCLSRILDQTSPPLTNTYPVDSNHPTTPLPPLILRTIIQTLSTYKSLLPFIANSILPKLIHRRVWENQGLWDGFMRVVKNMGSASFGGLMQLPRERLAEVVRKVPGIGEGLKGYLKGKGMGGAIVELFGEDS